MTVVVLGDLYALVARRGELAGLLGETQAQARTEPGCVSYAFAEVVGEPGRFVVAQEWRDEAALQAHYRAAAFTDYQERVGEFLARPSEVRIHHVRDTLHPEDGGPMDPRRAD
jgi:quinol monooxygenase YgiN